MPVIIILQLIPMRLNNRSVSIIKIYGNIELMPNASYCYKLPSIRHPKTVQP